ncbi:hypothetical protein ACFL2B_01160 [Patescibacteria group bacterium]
MDEGVKILLIVSVIIIAAFLAIRFIVWPLASGPAENNKEQEIEKEFDFLIEKIKE